MKTLKTFVYIDGETIKRIDCESFTQAEQFCGHGNVFLNREDADKEINLRTQIRVKPLTPEEIDEQNEWAREQMTEEEKAMVKRESRNIDYEQFLFAMGQMGIQGKEFYKRKDAFWNKYNATRNYRRAYA